MSDSWVERIGKTRKIAVEMIRARGFTVSHSLAEISSERLHIMTNLFQQGKGKDRPPTLDLHVVNTDAQVYIGWVREDKFEKDFKSVYKYFTETFHPSANDDLVIIVNSIKPPSEVAYSVEANNVSVFSLATLGFNITQHQRVPNHELVSPSEVPHIRKKLQVEPGQLPEINRFLSDDSRGDPVARFLGLRTGDVVKITRHTKTSGKHVVYREVTGTAPGCDAIGQSHLYSDLMDAPNPVTKPITSPIPHTPKVCTATIKLPPPISDLGKTEYKGPNYNKSYHGHSLQLLKSLIQKAIRRQDTDTVIWSASEISSFQQLYIEIIRLQHTLSCHPEDQLTTLISSHQDLIHRVTTKADQKNVPSFKRGEWSAWLSEKGNALQGLLRNYIHRLMIISVEDCFDGWIPDTLNTLLRDCFRLIRTNEFPSKLAEAQLYLAASRKIRLGSDIKAVYLLPGKRDASAENIAQYNKLAEDPGKFGLKGVIATQVALLLRDVKRIPDNFDGELQQDITRRIFSSPLKFVLQEPEGPIRTAALGIIASLMEKSDHVFYWINQLLGINQGCNPQPTGRGGKSKQCIYLIWKILQEYVNTLSVNPKAFLPVSEGLTAPDMTTSQSQFGSLKPVITILRSWYFDGNLGSSDSAYVLPESKLFLYYAFLLFNRIDQVNLNFGESITPPSYSQMSQLREGQALEIPGYAKDIHVRSISNQINKQIEIMLTQLQTSPDINLGDFLDTHYNTILSFVSEQDDLTRIVQKAKTQNLTLKELINFLTDEKRTPLHFARVAAQVKDEAEDLVDQRYRAVYLSLKGLYRDAASPETQHDLPKSTSEESESVTSGTESPVNSPEKKKRRRRKKKKVKKPTD